MTEVVAAWAAVAAAVFSLVNVLLSNRLARKTQVQQWRRDSVRKTIIDFLDAARELGDATQGLLDEMIQRELDMTIDDMFRTVHRKGFRHLVSVQASADRMFSELELVASDRCKRAARKLLELLYWPRIFDHISDPKDWDNGPEICRRLKHAIGQAREDFVLACRADLGVDQRRQRPKIVWLTRAA